MKKVHNKWQYGIRLEKCPPWRLGFYPTFTIWFTKFHSFPPEGECFSKENYKGIYWRYEFLRDIYVTEKTFIVPGWVRKIFPRVHQIYRLPFKFWIK